MKMVLFLDRFSIIEYVIPIRLEWVLLPSMQIWREHSLDMLISFSIDLDLIHAELPLLVFKYFIESE